MVQLGYHFHSLILHFINDPRNDFMEMLLHHLVTVFAIGCAYFMNYLEPSAIILLIHDVTDVFVHCSKMLVDTVYQKWSVAAFLVVTVSWFYFRLLVLPVQTSISNWE